MEERGARRLWAEAHAYYDGLTSTAPGGQGHERDWSWNRRLAESTPNGSLMRENMLFSALSSGKKLHLVHITSAFEQIRQQGVLYPSGGCLVGSVYCAPLTRAEHGFHMHNLGSYLLYREVPATLRRHHRVGAVPVPLIFEVSVPERAFRGLAGVDYLRLGEIHLAHYDTLENLLSRLERERLRADLVSRVRNSAGFLSMAAAVATGRGRVDGNRFIHALDQAVERLPALGYLYFETIAEYLMLHSRSRRTMELAELGEFNNWLYKELLFSAFPGMAGRFDLARFRLGPARLAQALHQADPTIEADHASNYLVERLSHLVTTRFFSDGGAGGLPAHTSWDFVSLRERLAPLLGHLVHRELRRFDRHPEFYLFFDQNKAYQAWDFWNHMDIVAPFNGTMPKGEVGINPAYPDLEFQVWRGEPDANGLLHPVEEVHLKLAKELVDVRHTIMRNSPKELRTEPS